MFDLYEAVKNCKLGAFLRTFENRIIITTLIFFKNYDESVALYIEPTDEENTYIISDCHSVTDYWETMYINPDDFKEQISKIGINFEDRCFNSKIYATNEQDLHSSIWRFIEKLFLLANIELLK